MLFVLDISSRDALLSSNNDSARGPLIDRVQDYCILRRRSEWKSAVCKHKVENRRYSPARKLKHLQMSSHLGKLISPYEPSHVEGRTERLTLQPIQILPLLFKIDILRHPHGQRSIYPPLIQIPLQQDLQILI